MCVLFMSLPLVTHVVVLDRVAGLWLHGVIGIRGIRLSLSRVGRRWNGTREPNRRASSGRRIDGKQRSGEGYADRIDTVPYRRLLVRA